MAYTLEYDVDAAPRRAFIGGYVNAMCWANVTDDTDDGAVTDAHAYWEKRQALTWNAVKALIRDAADFYREEHTALVAAVSDYVRKHVDALDSWEQCGHDFALTRAGHGTGFWDRGLPDDIGDALAHSARVYGDDPLTILEHADGSITVDTLWS